MNKKLNPVQTLVARRLASLVGEALRESAPPPASASIKDRVLDGLRKQDVARLRIQSGAAFTVSRHADGIVEWILSK